MEGPGVCSQLQDIRIGVLTDRQKVAMDRSTRDLWMSWTCTLEEESVSLSLTHARTGTHARPHATEGERDRCKRRRE